MSSPATVIYLKEPLKSKVKLEAKKNHKSISEYIRDLIVENLANPTKKTQTKKPNPLLQFVGIISDEDADIIDKNIAEARKDFRSKPDLYYQNLID